MEISFAGIEQAVEGLGYRNDNSPKSRLINTLRKRYSDSGIVDAVSAIDADTLIDRMWDLKGDKKAIRSKRKNLSSIKSSVNADLNEAWELGHNPEGITIGPMNTFIMSDAAKDRILSSFSGSVNLTGGNSLDRVAEALKIVSEYLSNLPGGLADDKLSNLKSLVEGLADKFRDDSEPGEFEITSVNADAEEELKGEDSAGEVPKSETIVEEENEAPSFDDSDLIEVDEDDVLDESDMDELQDEDEIVEEIDDAEQLPENDMSVEEIIEDWDEEAPLEDETETDDIAEEDAGDFEEIIEDDTEIVEIDESDLVDTETEIEEIDDEYDSEGIDPEETEIVEVADEGDAIEETEEGDLLDEEEFQDAEEEIGVSEELEEEVTLEEIDEADAEDIETDIEEMDTADPEVLDVSEIAVDEADDPDGMDPDDTDIVEVGDEEEVLGETEEGDFLDEEEFSEAEEETGDSEEFEEEGTLGEIDEADAEDFETEIVEVADEEEALGESEAVEFADEEELDEIEEAEELEDGVDLEEIDEAELDDVDAETDVVDVMDDADILEDEDAFEEVADMEDSDFEETSDSDDEVKRNDLGLPLDQLADEEFQPDEDQKRLLAERFDGYLGAMERFYNQYIIIKKGSYTIGAADTENDVLEERKISLPEFYMGKYPITNALFEVFIERTGYKTTAEKLGFGYVYQGRFQKTVDPVTGISKSTWNPTHTRKKVSGATWYQPTGPGSTLHQKRNHPVVQVSIRDARTFSAWTGKRLPTEIEWEAAARTLSGFIYPWGDEWIESCCNLENSGLSDTSPVDAHPRGSNESGIADLLGNVLEWTADECEPKYALETPARFFVAKGGAWVDREETPLYARNRFEADFTANILGFRCLAD